MTVYLDLTEPDSTDSRPRMVNFRIVTNAAGYPYRYAINIQQIDCNKASEELRG